MSNGGSMTLTVKTKSRTELIDITAQVQRHVDQQIKKTGLSNGLCMLFVPHTTAAVTINESADPSVKADILMILNQVTPFNAGYRHMEGNSAAHIKSTLVGASEQILIEGGQLVLGTWQGIFFCEFDGPRTRQLHIKLIGDRS
jgi:secondary thiamine-phosphate synthase enzyme